MTRERRKVRVGRVVSAKMDKTVLVAIRWQQRHLIYRKAQQKITKFYVHDAENQCKIGDLVRIEETRPLSRLKRWRLISILERREVPEITPVELDQQLLAPPEVVQDVEAAPTAEAAEPADLVKTPAPVTMETPRETADQVAAPIKAKAEVEEKAGKGRGSGRPRRGAAPVEAEAEVPEVEAQVAPDEEASEATAPVEAEAEVPEVEAQVAPDEEKALGATAPVEAEAEVPEVEAQVALDEEAPGATAPVETEAEVPEVEAQVAPEEEKALGATAPIEVEEAPSATVSEAPKDRIGEEAEPSEEEGQKDSKT